MAPHEARLRIAMEKDQYWGIRPRLKEATAIVEKCVLGALETEADHVLDILC